MLGRLKEKEEKITKVLSSLAEESAKGTLVLVEGRKDVEALRSLGITGPFVCVKAGGKSFLDIILKLETEKVPKVILLLDFDRRGKQTTNRFKRDLEKTRIKADIEFWRALSRLVGKDVQCVEGLASYLENLRIKVGKSN